MRNTDTPILNQEAFDINYEIIFGKKPLNNDQADETMREDLDDK